MATSTTTASNTAARAALLPYEKALRSSGYTTNRSTGMWGGTESVRTYRADGNLGFTVTAGVNDGVITATVYTVHSPKGNLLAVVKTLIDTPSVEEALALFSSFEKND